MRSVPLLRMIVCFCMLVLASLSRAQTAPLSDLDSLRYIASYSDLIEAFGADTSKGRSHYEQWGIKEGRKITFEPSRYMAGHADLIQAFKGDELKATIHYIQFGYKERRQTTFSDLDALQYIASYGDLIQAFGSNVLSGIRHYVLFGYQEGRRVLFDALSYIASYGDLIVAFSANAISGVQHYINWGYKEGRQISFSASAYLAVPENADVRSAVGGNPQAAATHYISFGFREGRATSVAVAAPKITLSQNSLSFSGQGIGTRSAAQSITVTNVGNAVLEIRRVAVIGSGSSSFLLTSNCQRLPPGSSCALDVRFAPMGSTASTASLSVEHNAAGGLSSVALTGQPAAVVWQQGVTGNYYAFVPAPAGVSWSEAHSAAGLIPPPIAGLTVNLASITSQIESDLVWSLVPVNTFYRSPSGCACYEFGPWIGGSQNRTAANFAEPAGGWQWTDGEAFIFTNWLSGEPNNAYSTENHVHLVRVNGVRGWNDLTDDPQSVRVDPTFVFGFVVEAERLPRTGWTAGPRGSYYRYVSVPSGITWSAARDAAAVATGPGAGYTTHLATITAEDEALAVNAMLPTSAFPIGQFGGGRSDTAYWGPWIGGYQDKASRNYSEPTGGWRWVTDEPWSYTRWDNNAPNNDFLGRAEEYLHLYFRADSGGSVATARWNDIIDSPNNGVVGYVVEATPRR